MLKIQLHMGLENCVHNKRISNVRDLFTIGPGNCVHIRRRSHLRGVQDEKFLCMFPIAS